MTYDWVLFISSLLFILGIVILSIASFIHYRKNNNKLLIFSGMGFAIAAMGRIYQEYINRYPGLPENLGIQETLNILNEQLTYSNIVAAEGLTLSGVSYLLYVLKK